MKNRVLQFFALFLAASMLFSCQDEFTEEDALNAQQQIDVAVYVYNAATAEEAPVAGATVTLIQGGETRTATTDDSGAAIFNDAKVGGFIYTVDGDNFSKVVEEGDFEAADFRQGQETFLVGVYPSDAENTAIIKGRVAIEMDLTNKTTEYASGIELLAFVELNEGTKTFAVTTDENGYYEFSVPADFDEATDVEIRFPDLELSQSIAYRKLATESGSFPEVLPEIKEYPVLFSMYTGGAENYDNYPTNINPVYGLAEDSPNDDNAVIGDVYVNSDGEITGVNINDGGDYTGFASDSVDVQFTDITGAGSGALLRFSVQNHQDLYWAYYYNEYRLVPGSGYTDYDVNYTSYASPSVNEIDRQMQITVYPGTTTVSNVDYGTGIYREDDLD